ncbi:cyclopropane-fatty-acyl-phospholipid synthase family protein [Mesorhizobium sp. YC-39]|uniref:SAM-dependent methyltransferase n=1 Tax=unclassified Mesorhizobium TaxID=325217 RepID=UPI0021E92F95|nr:MULTISPECIES: cyclopropane-fatty-acyl-phospholipid synthase family protein [unclassified Mesorhizobium]MCV3210457.1 cyclopropane-fatty-acyl-phospholipid synthase family protein [Mesorhizobium sp. YC-2]MCV3232645.1 cyclopropane-fatty-acyl-phospholipid synthase family protein [Mesorhizobium sp. YC-39]
MNVLLRHVLERLVRQGSLRVTGPDGRIDKFGDGSGEPAHIHIKSRRAERAITFDPMLALPEAYMSSEVDIPEGGVLGLMRIVFQNIGNAGIDTAWTKALDRVRHAFRRFQQINTTRRSRRNVEVHYDLSVELYKLFLDDDMQYSCAYFQRPDMTLEEAQSAKKRHIAAKLQLKPGLKVLDIGSGWGGLGLYLARSFETDVLGVTLSSEQHAVATERARSDGESRAHFDVKDYRELGERFDRIVSVGMFEHVGVNHYSTFFDKCATLLNPDGVVLLHTVGRSGPPSVTSAFVRKHIFPGGYVPALSEVLPAIEKAGLVVTDVEILRLHYADTLKHWGQRFAANREKAKAIYDERFCRMWEFYLAASEASFRWQDLVVFQIQLTRGNDTLPNSRDYMAKCERMLKLREIAHTERV